MDFVTVTYELSSDKLYGTHRFVLLADLHNTEHGPENADLIRAVRDLDPELILCPGDMILGRAEEPYRATIPFLREAASIAPTFLSNGNHETRLRLRPALYEAWEMELAAAGVTVLNNASAKVTLGRDQAEIYGLEIDETKYRKFRRPNLHADELDAHLPDLMRNRTERGTYRILLAHNPAFAERYAAASADLVVSGHYHGGMIRTGSDRALFSPYGWILPKYGYGHIRLADTEIVVTSGLGDHTIPFRLRNPMEIVNLEITGTKAPEAAERES